jgi:hypothetical protein
MVYFVDTTPKPDPTVETSPCPDGNILYVNQQAIGDNHGKDWTNAFIDLQDAFQLAASDTCSDVNQIWVAKGTYTPTNGADRTATFQLLDNVGIYGGFAGAEIELQERNIVNNPTLLSGDIGITGNMSDNSYHVVTGSGTDGSAILNGFTITGGMADNGTECPDACGAGLLNIAGNPTLIHLIFHENTAVNAGGGLYNSDWSMPTLLFSHLHHNSANAGGGILNDDSFPLIRHTFVNHNTAVDGAGILNRNGGQPKLINVNISDNQGVGMVNDQTTPIISHVVLANNTDSGLINTGVDSLILNHLILSGNQNAGFQNIDSTVTLSQATIGSNQDYGVMNQASLVTVHNTIIWDHDQSIFDDIGSQTVVSYSLIQGGWEGEGNKDQDPNFTTVIDRFIYVNKR